MADKNEERQDWMRGVSKNLDIDDYLHGQKIDKTFELAKEEKAKAEREAKINLIKEDKIRFKADPILELQRKKDQLKHEILTNPVLLKKFREFLDKHEANLDDKQEKQSRPSTSDKHSRNISKLEHESRSKASQSNDYIRTDHDHRHRSEATSKHSHKRGYSPRRDHRSRSRADRSDDRHRTERHDEKNKRHYHERHRDGRRHQSSKDEYTRSYRDGEKSAR